MSQQDSKARVFSARLARKPSRAGVIAGLSVPSLIVVGVGVAPALIAAMVGQPLAGLAIAVIWGVPLSILGIGHYQGRSYVQIAWAWTLFTVRKVTGQTHVIVPPDARRAVTDHRLTIPGAVGERIHMLSIVGVPKMAGAAYLWDAAERTASVVLRFAGDSFKYADVDARNNRAAYVSEVAREIADMQGVTQIALHARNLPAGTTHLPVPPSVLGDDLEASVVELASWEKQDLEDHEYISGAWKRDVLVTITVSADKAKKRIAAGGGGQMGLSKLLVEHVHRLHALLNQCGVNAAATRWLSARQIHGAMAQVFDLDAAYDLDPDGGLDVGGILTGSLSENPDYVVTDSAFHRSWWVPGWPPYPVDAGFLSELVAGGSLPHTVTQIWEGVTLEKSESRQQTREQSIEDRQRTNQKLGRPQKADFAIEQREVNKMRGDLMAGYGEMNHLTLITVHARTIDQLEEANQWLRTSTPGMRVAVARGQQWATFVACALPLGIGRQRR